MTNDFKVLNCFADELCCYMDSYLAQKQEIEREYKNQKEACEANFKAEQNSLKTDKDGEYNRIQAEYSEDSKRADQIKRTQMEIAQKDYNTWQNAAGAYRTRIQEAYDAVAKQIVVCATSDEGFVGNPNIEEAVWYLTKESNSLSHGEDYNADILDMYKHSKELLDETSKIISQMLDEAKAEYESRCDSARRDCAAKMNSLGAHRDDELNKWKEKFSTRTVELERAIGTKRSELDSKLEEDLAHLANKTIENFAADLHIETLREIWVRVQNDVPKYPGYVPATASMGGMLMGNSCCDVTQYMKDSVLNKCISDNLRFALVQSDVAEIVMPYGVSFEDRSFSSLIAYDSSESRSRIVSNLNAIALQLFMTNPACKIRFTFISPSDAGSSFARFMRFNDVDERLVDSRIWGDAGRIEERLDILLERAQTINQQYLQERYANILEYNNAAGKNAEPLQFLIVIDFPRAFSQRALEKLENIMDNGPKTGIFTLIGGDRTELMGSIDGRDADRDAVLRRVLSKLSYFRCDSGDIYVPPMRSQNVKNRVKNSPPDLIYEPLILPDNTAHIDSVIATLMDDARRNQKVVIESTDVLGELENQPERWFGYSDRDGISLPFAIYGANKVLSLDIGTKTYHTLINGMTGSGKSTLMHALLMSLLLKYSPEDVQIYLMDFKEGIEARPYAEHNLKNFTVVSVATEPEFGLLVLQKIKEEMEERGKLFGEKGVAAIGGYRQRLHEEHVAHHNMPRIVLVVDEYQEAFKKANDETVDESISKSVEIIQQLALMGRAFGIYIVLSTQDVKNANAIPENLYNQFEVRIAMKSTADPARVILPNNPIADQLITLDSGVAIFNDAAGGPDENHNIRCKVALYTKDKINKLLSRIEQRQRSADFARILENHHARILLSDIAVDRYNPLKMFIDGMADSDLSNVQPMGYRMFIGQAVSLESHLNLELRSLKGQNLLITGSDENRARTTVLFAMLSVLYEAVRLGDAAESRPLITLFDFGGDYIKDNIRRMTAALPAGIVRTYGVADVLHGLSELEEHYDKDVGRQIIIICGLNRAKRLVMQPDAFTEAPMARLIELFKNGPERDMNFIVWADNATTFLQQYGQALPYFEHRLVGGISVDQYSAFLEGDEVKNALPKQNAIYFNPDRQLKVRLYNAPTDDWLNRFVQGICGLSEYENKNRG